MLCETFSYAHWFKNSDKATSFKLIIRTRVTIETAGSRHRVLEWADEYQYKKHSGHLTENSLSEDFSRASRENLRARRNGAL